MLSGKGVLPDCDVYNLNAESSHGRMGCFDRKPLAVLSNYPPPKYWDIIEGAPTSWNFPVTPTWTYLLRTLKDIYILPTNIVAMVSE